MIPPDVENQIQDLLAAEPNLPSHIKPDNFLTPILDPNYGTDERSREFAPALDSTLLGGNFRYWNITNTSMWAGQNCVLDEIHEVLWDWFGFLRFTLSACLNERAHCGRPEALRHMARAFAAERSSFHRLRRTVQSPRAGSATVKPCYLGPGYLRYPPVMENRTATLIGNMVCTELKIIFREHHHKIILKRRRSFTRSRTKRFGIKKTRKRMKKAFLLCGASGRRRVKYFRARICRRVSSYPPMGQKQ